MRAPLIGAQSCLIELDYCICLLCNVLLMLVCVYVFFCHFLLISLFVSQIKCDVQDLTSNRDHDDKVPSNPNLRIYLLDVFYMKLETVWKISSNLV